MAEEDGDLDGFLEVGVSDVKSIEGPGRNAVGIEDFVAPCLGGQSELESVKTFASGSKWSDAVLRMCDISEFE